MDLDLDLVRQLSEAPVAFIPPVSKLIILSTYLLMGVGRLVALLSWVSSLFGLTFRGGY